MNDRPIEIRIKAVPNASRDAIAGMLGDRLKVCVSAPPEGGRANGAIAALLARELGVRPAQVEIIAGHTGPDKVVRVTGCDPARVRSLLGATGA